MPTPPPSNPRSRSKVRWFFYLALFLIYFSGGTTTHADVGLVGMYAPPNGRLEKLELLMFVDYDKSQAECVPIKKCFFPDTMDVWQSCSHFVSINAQFYVQVKLILSAFECVPDSPVGFDLTLPHEVLDNVITYLMLVKQVGLVVFIISFISFAFFLRDLLFSFNWFSFPDDQ
jgi:hypothetical protein